MTCARADIALALSVSNLSLLAFALSLCPLSRRDNAQSSAAAQFIYNNLCDHFQGKWLHVDMAANVRSGERATGYGVALLLELLRLLYTSA